MKFVPWRGGPIISREPRRSLRYDRESIYRAHATLMRKICEVHDHVPLIKMTIRRHAKERTNKTTNSIQMEIEQIPVASTIARESLGSPKTVASVASTSSEQIRRKEEQLAKETTKWESPKLSTPLRQAGSTASALVEDITTIMYILQVVRSAKCPNSDHRSLLIRLGSLIADCPPLTKTITNWQKVSAALEEIDTPILNSIPNDIVSTDDIDNAIGALTDDIRTVVESSSRTVPAKSDRRKLPRDVRTSN
ncbi:hypothetical protein EVAR_93415_1 [Eumeta japonica]|uniref:Uncharacterized protein n=1 Tax=Eumeta variegata TaxID=151549 RepID=A0A4C1UPU9_EUMVA|nr:hypothetical protein EVAR_93415_1 [Eumeta japonica]